MDMTRKAFDTQRRTRRTSKGEYLQRVCKGDSCPCGIRRLRRATLPLGVCLLVARQCGFRHAGQHRLWYRLRARPRARLESSCVQFAKLALVQNAKPVSRLRFAAAFRNISFGILDSVLL